ncbi:hypothetical protein RR46_00868 [Papilio xuthus]|uniref:Uncharacterized protein n=1 Tax=Papilio xuthus TaxID=66420 RepID=A0A0N1ICY2_PAPXU|nr:hypothetical protein RR46_00868 [Papilio xuthus]
MARAGPGAAAGADLNNKQAPSFKCELFEYFSGDVVGVGKGDFYKVNSITSEVKILWFEHVRGARTGPTGHVRGAPTVYVARRDSPNPPPQS